MADRVRAADEAVKQLQTPGPESVARILTVCQQDFVGVLLQPGEHSVGSPECFGRCGRYQPGRPEARR